MQLRLAEYQALTTRITCWITIQYSVLGVIVAILIDFIKQAARPIETSMRVWTVVVAIEALIGAFYYTLFEIMTHSDYIENKLTKDIERELPDTGSAFWGYERYKNRDGRRVYSPAGMYFLLIPCFTAPFAALRFYRPLEPEIVDYFFIALSLGVALWAFRIARTAVSAQRRFAP